MRHINFLLILLLSNVSVAYDVVGPNGKFAVSIEPDERIKLWQVKGNKYLSTYKDRIDSGVTIRFSNSGKQVIITDSLGDISIWNIRSHLKQSTKTSPKKGNIYSSVKQKNTISAYHKYIRKYPNSPHKNKALKEIYSLTKRKNTIKGYRWFIKNYPNSPYATKMVRHIYNFVKKNKNISSYQWFVEKYKRYPEAKLALKDMLNLLKSKESDIKTYTSFIKRYRNYPIKSKALDALHLFIVKQKNIRGFLWFLTTYKKDLSNRQKSNALTNLYKLAFSIAKKHNTINAYNDFIIAYPYSKDITKANELVYKLELDKYTGWFLGSANSKDSIAKKLIIKLKKIDFRASKTNMKDGFYLVIKRMNQLLEDEFSSAPSALDYLDSEKYEHRLDNIKRAKVNILKTMQRIRKGDASISDFTKTQVFWIGYYFKKSAASKKMSTEYKKESIKWKRIIKKI